MVVLEQSISSLAGLYIWLAQPCWSRFHHLMLTLIPITVGTTGLSIVMTVSAAHLSASHPAQKFRSSEVSQRLLRQSNTPTATA